jgi:anthranilate synthase/aminodeoxychorismate synthase-like glutamine amidotransferase
VILLIDNYDSFTFNLFQLLSELGAKVEVRRNDALTVEGLASLAPSALVISPGPGAPVEAGVSCDAIRHFSRRMPVLGVCLGHQAIGEVFGGRVVRAPEPRHGKVSRLKHDGRGLFRGLPSELGVARYHSLAVEESSLPDCLEITARSEDGVIMGLRHRELAVEGVQFHPESVASEHGREMMSRFLELSRARDRRVA